jgi:chromosome segregation ATPase
MNAALEGLIARSTASGWVLCALVVGGLFQQWRMWTSQRPKMRELSDAADSSLRHDLMEQIDKLWRQLSDERRECDKQIDAMQVEIKTLRDKIDGLVRQLIAYQVAEARRGEVSPPMQRALGRLEDIAGTAEQTTGDDHAQRHPHPNPPQ